jgi:hypothetical protein
MAVLILRGMLYDLQKHSGRHAAKRHERASSQFQPNDLPVRHGGVRVKVDDCADDLDKVGHEGKVILMDEWTRVNSQESFLSRDG